jgi:hypothetical protein
LQSLDGSAKLTLNAKVRGQLGSAPAKNGDGEKHDEIWLMAELSHMPKSPRPQGAGGTKSAFADFM